jgi:L-threonylcarbamoyladenylate synthase
LIDALGEGIAAPSANRSSRLPPVRPQHVLKGLQGHIDMVIDGGACPSGVESTVVDLTGAKARVVRRGGVSFDRIAALVEAEDCAQPVQGAGWVRIVDELRAGEGTAALLMRARSEVGMEHRVLGEDAASFGAAMYDALHELEDAGYTQVLVEQLPAGGEWDAIRDRLARL